MDAVLSIAALVFYGRKQGKRLLFGRRGTERPCNAEAHSLKLKHNSIYRSIRNRERIGEGSRKMIESIWQEMGLPLLFTVLLLYYAIKLLVFHDVESIRPKERRFRQKGLWQGSRDIRFDFRTDFFSGIVLHADSSVFRNHTHSPGADSQCRTV